MRSVLRLLAVAYLAVPLLAQQPTRPAITGVAFFRDYTTHPAQAQQFYSQTLGLAQLTATDEPGTWIFPINRSQWVEVLHDTPPPTANGRMAAVGFTTRDVRALERFLNAHGVATIEPLHNSAFAVRDPEGNLVYFVQSPYPTATGNTPLTGVAQQVSTVQPLPSATSVHVIHVGFIVHDAAREDAFWRDLLGFRPYWHGSARDNTPDDYRGYQVPDGTDWLEYMLNQPADPSLQLSGVMDHLSLGTERMQTVLATLQRNGCEGKNCTALQAGRDGKIQLNLYDPDFTRIEFMEFTPTLKPCCSPFLGTQPTAQESQ